MAEYIEREKVRDKLYENDAITFEGVKILNTFPTADVVEVVRCEKCKHSRELAPHSEISPYYRHCDLWRGEETKNVWHKYKKYYADYSIVEPTDYCSYGELKEREQ